MASHQSEINFYKNFAKKYDDRKFSRAALWYYDYWDKLLLKKIKKDKKLQVLDLGCGTGDFLFKLKRYYPKAVGVDISEEMLALARKKYPQLADSFKKAFAEKLPFKDGQLNAVFIRGSLHHFQNPQKSLQEIDRVLKRKGQLILLEPIGDFFIIKILRQLFFRIKPKKFLKAHRSFTKKELVELLTKRNFFIKETKRLGLLAYPLLARPDIFPLVKLFKAKWFVNYLVRLDDFIVEKLFGNKVSLIIVIYAQKK